MTSARQPQPDPAVLAQLRRRLLAEHADWLHGTRTVVRNRIVRRPSGLIGIDLDPVAEAIRSADQALEIIALSIEFFAQLGWAPSGSMPLAVYEAAIRAVADGMTAEDAEEILVKGWNDQLVLLRIHHRVRGLGLGVDDEVASWYQDRGRLVRRAWEHHVAGAFEAAIPMVFAQIDGITADATTTPATPAGRMFFSTRPGRQAEVVDDTTLAGMDDALPVVREYFSIGRHVTGALGSEARHGVMHGRELHYDTRANSTKAFVLLAAVVEWARPRVQALIERRRAERD